MDGGNPGSRPAGRAVARRRPAHDGQGVPGLTELTRAGAASALATLADRLAARRRFQPAGTRPEASAVDDQRGTLRAYRQAGEHDRALLTWVSLGRTTSCGPWS